MHRLFILASFFTAVFLVSCKDETPDSPPELFQLLRVQANGVTLSTDFAAENLPVTSLFIAGFSAPVDSVSAKTSITLLNNGTPVPIALLFSDGGKSISIQPVEPLPWKSDFELSLSNQLKGAQKQTFPGVSYTFSTENGTLSLVSSQINGTTITTSSRHRGIPFDTLKASFTFSEPLAEGSLSSFVSISPAVALNVSVSTDRKTLSVSNATAMDYYRRYQLSVSGTLQSATGFTFKGFTKSFVTGLNPSIKNADLSDDALLTKVQEFTFKYFWDFAHPVSGLARERNSSGDIVTIGGSGFGIMGIPIGIERGFISREQGIARLQKIVSFLAAADRFHGVWPHWLNGNTGKTVPFSTNDNGGDLVESAFMAQGLITVRQYLKSTDSAEASLIDQINQLLDAMEWDWYTRGGQNVLYWHWSATKGWAMNMQIKGYNEALIVYVLAATSKNHAVQPAVYTQGWASNGNIRNNKTFYGIQLPVGYDYGGPLFFAHYSFLGLDPRNLSDTYANYWTQNVAHSRINYEHCVRNPQKNLGYSASSWGLTASDNPTGYGVQEPTRDPGTITPTAALSSIPYTPVESIAAIRHFYTVLGDKLWGQYGFYDAFNPNEGWWASSYLAIDQGPILVMIENHRTGLCWDLFMSAPEVQTGLQNLGFSFQPLSKRFN